MRVATRRSTPVSPSTRPRLAAGSLHTAIGLQGRLNPAVRRAAQLVAFGANLLTISVGHTLDLVEAVLGAIVEVDARMEILWPIVKLADIGEESSLGQSVHCVGRQFGRVQYSAVEYHFRDSRIGVDRLRRILSE